MYKIIPKKSLGQHWLHDEDVLEDICDLAELEPSDNVVEIGPGLGTLTAKLLERGANVAAVEFDSELSDQLQKNLISKNLTVINQDILKFDFTKMPEDYKVVANIPYYLTSNLIRVFTESDSKPSLAVLLVQKEVAQRICDKPGRMSLLSVWAQINFECSLGPVVPAKLFTPPPKVDSQVVVMKKLAKPLDLDVDRKTLTRVLKAGFSNKRKTLHNSLSAGLNISKDESKKILELSNINPMSRPQDLSIDDWLKLARNT